MGKDKVGIKSIYRLEHNGVEIGYRFVLTSGKQFDVTKEALLSVGAHITGELETLTLVPHKHYLISAEELKRRKIVKDISDDKLRLDQLVSLLF